MTSILLTAGAWKVALPASAIRQVVKARRIIPVPLSAPLVQGVVALEGRAVPVYRLVDMRLEGLPEGAGQHPGTAQSLLEMKEIVVIEQDGALAGFLVERADPFRAQQGAPAPSLNARALMAAAGVFPAEEGGRPAARAAQGEP